MKILFVVTVLAFSALVGCKTKEVKPEVPPIIVVPPPPPPTEGPGAVDPDAEYCKQGDKKFNCGNPVWYGLKGCKPDSDGDNHAEGTAYFMSLEEIKAMAEKQNVSVKVKMKDGSTQQFGIGFAAPCFEM